jgi:hypothetical protein
MTWTYVDKNSGFMLHADPFDEGVAFYLGDAISKTEICILDLNSIKQIRAMLELEIERLTLKPFKFCGYTPIHPSHVHCTPDSKLLKCMGYETYGKSGV